MCCKGCWKRRFRTAMQWSSQVLHSLSFTPRLLLTCSLNRSVLTVAWVLVHLKRISIKHVFHNHPKQRVVKVAFFIYKFRKCAAVGTIESLCRSWPSITDWLKLWCALKWRGISTDDKAVVFFPSSFFFLPQDVQDLLSCSDTRVFMNWLILDSVEEKCSWLLLSSVWIEILCLLRLKDE